MDGDNGLGFNEYSTNHPRDLDTPISFRLEVIMTTL